MKDPLLSLSVLCVCSATFKFLVDGIVLNLGHMNLSLGHVDPIAYATFLAPVLGAHGYVHVKKFISDAKAQPGVDNDDSK